MASCGQNAEQKAAMQKQHDDSVARIAAQKAQQHDADVSNLKVYQQQLEGFVADMNAANAKMTEIKSEDCWLQSCKDRKIQNIRNQTLVIEHIQDNINNSQANISKIKSRLDAN